MTEAERSRAQQVYDAAAQAGVPFVHATSAGDVHIDRVTYHCEDGVDWVEVWTAGDTAGGDPHFRVVNPPILVADPAGDVHIGTGRFRRDPLAALAEAVAAAGGARSSR